ncbi:MAG: outer membrane lipoprotein-sorting protein [Chlorobi bacterium]|nr:outer membrane lipoprotein-sorting protein [Chlorobiota bacterium]
MKKISTLIFAIIFASIPTYAQDLSLDQILKNYYEVMGIDNLKDVSNMVMTGKSVNGGMETPFTIYNVRPDKYRLEVPIQGQLMLQVYNSGTGWMVAPWSGSLDAQDIPAEQLKSMKRQADMEGPLYNYKEKGNTVELIGKEDMEGSDVYKVKLTYPDGDNELYFIDSENFVILKVESTTNMRGQEVKSEMYFSDFKPEGNMLMAHSFQVKMGGQISQSVVIEAVKYNTEIDSGIFNKPEPKPVPEAK